MYQIGWVKLDGVVNMRDVGGIPTVDGRTIRSGRLLRSDHVQDLSDADVDYLLDQVGVADVIDLRSDVEVDREGPGPLTRCPRVRITRLSLYPERSDEDGIPAGERELPWTRQARQPPTDRSPRVHEQVWSTHYLGYLSRCPDSVVAALRVIATSPGAVLVHCAAGKDRTGTVVALALAVAGATPEAIAHDYAASAQRVPEILSRLRQRAAYRETLANKTVAEQSPRVETMRLLLSILDRDHGGVLEWLSRHGWERADTVRLQAALVDR